MFSRHSNRSTLRCSAVPPRRRLGAYTVEFAMCLPVFFGVVFGCLEVARLMYVRQAIDQTSYEAARVGVATGITAEQCRQHANLLLAAYGIQDATVTVIPSTFNAQTENVTVRISCDFAANSWITPEFVTGGPMETEVTLDHENQAYLVPQAKKNASGLSDNNEPIDI